MRFTAFNRLLCNESMNKTPGFKIVLLIAVLLLAVVLYKIGYESWLSHLFDKITQLFFETSGCDDNYPKPFDEKACQEVIDRYRTVDFHLSWPIKYIAFSFISYFCSRIIIGNRNILGYDFVAVVIMGLASIAVPFTITDPTVYGVEAFMSMVPLVIGCSYFLYTNRKLHNKKCMRRNTLA